MATKNRQLVNDPRTFQLPTSFAHREEGVEARLSHVGREDRGWL
jgi:hypothetical protein